MGLKREAANLDLRPFYFRKVKRIKVIYAII